MLFVFPPFPPSHLILFYFIFSTSWKKNKSTVVKRILWRPKMVSPMEPDELRAVVLQNFDIHGEAQ